MTFALVATSLWLFALPGIAAPLGRRMPPAEWARVARLSTGAGRFLLRAALVMLILPMVLQAVGFSHAALTCWHVSAFIDSAYVGGIAVAVLIVMETAGVRSDRRARRFQSTVRVEPWLGEHLGRGDHELVVLPTEEHIAYAVEGSPSQVVVSRGLLETLSDVEADAVVRHELAHLRYGHHRHLRLAAAIEAMTFGTTLGRRTAAAMRAAVERWADEVAAAAGDRDVVRDALAKCVQRKVVFAPAFNGAGTVLERLDALAAGPPERDWRLRVAVGAPVVVLCTVGVVAALGAVAGHGLAGLAGLCS